MATTPGWEILVYGALRLKPESWRAYIWRVNAKIGKKFLLLKRELKSKDTPYMLADISPDGKQFAYLLSDPNVVYLQDIK